HQLEGVFSGPPKRHRPYGRGRISEPGNATTAWSPRFEEGRLRRKPRRPAHDLSFYAHPRPGVPMQYRFLAVRMKIWSFDAAGDAWQGPSLRAFVATSLNCRAASITVVFASSLRK